jgi:hypothetical protein
MIDESRVEKSIGGIGRRKGSGDLANSNMIGMVARWSIWGSGL